MVQPSPNDLPFDRDRFSDRVACQVMPQLDDEAVTVVVEDWDGNKLTYNVPPSSVLRMNMPRLAEGAPEEVKQLFDPGLGLGLVACKVVNRHEDLASVNIPTVPEPSTVVVEAGRIARRVN